MNILDLALITYVFFMSMVFMLISFRLYGKYGERVALAVFMARLCSVLNLVAALFFAYHAEPPSFDLIKFLIMGGLYSSFYLYLCYSYEVSLLPFPFDADEYVALDEDEEADFDDYHPAFDISRNYDT